VRAATAYKENPIDSAIAASPFAMTAASLFIQLAHHKNGPRRPRNENDPAGN
jgi:hypothetical protein